MRELETTVGEDSDMKPERSKGVMYFDLSVDSLSAFIRYGVKAGQTMREGSKCKGHRASVARPNPDIIC